MQLPYDEQFPIDDSSSFISYLDSNPALMNSFIVEAAQNLEQSYSQNSFYILEKSIIKEKKKEQAQSSKEQMKQACGICYQQYDEKERMPMLICHKNQHVCCRTCVKNLFTTETIKCPNCRELIKKRDVTVFRLYAEFMSKVTTLIVKLKQETSQRQQSTKSYESLLSQKLVLQNQIKTINEKLPQALSLLNRDLESKIDQISSLKREVEQTVKNGMDKEKELKQQIGALSSEIESIKKILSYKEQSILQYLSQIRELQQQIKFLHRKIQELTFLYNANSEQQQQIILRQRQQNEKLKQKFELFKVKVKEENLAYNDKIGGLLKLNQKQLWLERGHAYLKKAKYQIAADIFTNLIESNPDQEVEIFGLGSVQDIRGYYQRREGQLYFELSKSKKLKYNPYDGLSCCFLKTKKYQQAKIWYELMLQNKPHNYQLLFGLANALYNLNQYSQAEKVYRKVISIRPDFDKPYQLIASIYYNLGSVQKNDQTRMFSQDALKLKPNNIYAQFMLSALEQDSLKKEKELIEILRTEPSFVRAKSALALLYISLKSTDKALQLSKQCITANPFYDRPYLNIGYIYQAEQKNDLARSVYKKCIQENPESQNVCLQLSKLYLKLGKFDKSIKAIKRGLQINPNFVKGYEALGKIHFSKGDMNQSIKYYEKCASFEYQKEKYYELIADVFFFNLNNHKKAKEYYEKCMSENPENKQALCQLKMIDYQSKRNMEKSFY